MSHRISAAIAGPGKPAAAHLPIPEAIVAGQRSPLNLSCACRDQWHTAMFPHLAAPLTIGVRSPPSPAPFDRPARFRPPPGGPPLFSLTPHAPIEQWRHVRAAAPVWGNANEKRPAVPPRPIRRRGVRAVPAARLPQGRGLHRRGARPADRRHPLDRLRLQPLPQDRAAGRRSGRARRAHGRRAAVRVPDHLAARGVLVSRPRCCCAT